MYIAYSWRDSCTAGGLMNFEKLCANAVNLPLTIKRLVTRRKKLFYFGRTWLILMLRLASQILQSLICWFFHQWNTVNGPDELHAACRFFLLPFSLALGLGLWLKLPPSTTSSEPEQAALRWHGTAAAPQRSFGRPPGAVGWMVAPSLHSPNVHTWLQGSCATVQPGPGHEPGEKVFLSPLF